jgi:predicted glycosyltransferase
LILTEHHLAVRLSILVYAQALSGVGHYVRSFEIARSLAQSHNVLLVDGGRRVPRPAEDQVHRLELPRMARGANGLEPLSPAVSLAQALRERALRLSRAVTALRPDVVIIEHYPFSKWELESEISLLLKVARAARPGVLIVCSLRDIVRQTRNETCGTEIYVAEVLRRLQRDFNAVMVHGDQRLTPLEASFDGAAAVRMPLCYTGIVAEATVPPVAATTPYVLVSSGGGTDPLNLAAAVAAALARPELRERLAGVQLIVCRGLATGSPAASGAWLERPFGADFLSWLAGATLSFSYAGYNTCANLLATRTRALLATHPAMSDQPARAALMVSLGAAHAVPPADWAAQPLAASILSTLASPVPVVSVNLAGAQRSAAFIEELWRQRLTLRPLETCSDA